MRERETLCLFSCKMAAAGDKVAAAGDTPLTSGRLQLRWVTQ